MRRRSFLKSAAALGGLLASGQRGLALPAPQENQPSAAQDSTGGAGKFIDITASSGVRFVARASHTAKKYLPETMGSGVALFDYDNDGRLDIFFVNGAPLSDPTPPGTIPKKTGPEFWNRLYHQNPDGTFEDVTEKAGLQGVGYDMGVAVGDYDNDGYQDLYVTGLGGNRLYHNNGDGTFTDVTEPSGTGGGGWSTSAVWVDLDNDGLLDLVVLRYLKWDFSDIWCGEHRPGYRAYCHPNLFPRIEPLVYHNEGNGRFTEIAAKIGMKAGKGLGVSLADYDRDGHIDFFVSNDSMPEFLYHNNGNGTFTEDGLLSGVAVNGMGSTFAGMGTDFQDYNNDGWPDLIVTDLAMQKYTLYENNRDGTFSDATSLSGIGETSLLHSGWGVCFLDYDNDGLKDLIIVQGHVIDNIHLQFPDLHYQEPMMLLHNIGSGKFVEVSQASGEVFHQRWAGRGLARGDIDNDGRIDVVVTTNDGPAYIVRNVTPTDNHWITLLLVGHKSNRDAIGAVVKLTTAAGPQWWIVSTGGSYCSSSDKRAHFGLGAESEAVSIEIQWPSGIHQVLHHVKSNQILRIDEPVEA